MENKTLEKAIQDHIDTLKDFQNELFERGHDFWHCDAIDASKGMPFWYYQRNRSVNMSTCGTCQKLMELRRKIRKLESVLFGTPNTPLRTDFKELKHVQRMHVSSSSEFNPNYQYLAS